MWNAMKNGNVGIANAVGAISKGTVFNKMYLEYIVLYLTSPTVLLNTEVQTNGLTSNA
jgi:hypothetical protein